MERITDTWASKELKLKNEIKEYNTMMKHKMNIFVLGQKNSQKTRMINLMMNVLLNEYKDYELNGEICYIDEKSKGYREYNTKNISSMDQPYNISFYDTDENDYTNISDSMKYNIQCGYMGKLYKEQKIGDPVPWLVKKANHADYLDFSVFIIDNEIPNYKKIQYAVHLACGGNTEQITINKQEQISNKRVFSFDPNVTLKYPEHRCALLQLILDLTTLSLSHNQQRYDKHNVRNTYEYSSAIDYCNIM